MKKSQKELVKRMDAELEKMFSNVVGLEALIKPKRK